MKDIRAPQNQLQYNRRTADAWDRYRDHRNRLGQILSKIKVNETCSNLAILGAGNLNDFDLNVWIQTFQRIVLVDIDRDAVCHGLARQSLSKHERIENVAPFDLTSSIETGSELQNSIPSGPFEIVVSSGLLSQLIETVISTQAHSEDQLEVVSRIRRQHLQLLFQSLAPSGSIVLVNDIVSTSTAPQLNNVPESSLGNFTQQLLEAGNFFTGNHPGVILNEIQQISGDRGIAIELDFHHPWLWQIGPDKHHLMWGITIQTTPQDAI